MNKKEDNSNTKKQDKTEPSEEKNGTSIAAESLAIPNDEPVTKPTESKEATPPHEKQRDYWKEDLLLKNRTFCLSLIGFIAIILSIGFNAYQISISTEQLKLNTTQVELNTAQSKRLALSICYSLQSDAYAHLFNMDKVFIERGYLRPYFYESKDIGDKDKRYQEVLATAEMTLDLFDLVSDFNDPNKNYKECWDESETWDKWIVDTFSTSPILRKTMEERRGWYAGNLWKLYQKALDRNKK